MKKKSYLLFDSFILATLRKHANLSEKSIVTNLNKKKKTEQKEKIFNKKLNMCVPSF